MMVDEVAEDHRRCGSGIEDPGERDGVTQRPGLGRDRWHARPRRKGTFTGPGQRIDHGPAPGLLERMCEHPHDRSGCH